MWGGGRGGELPGFADNQNYLDFPHSYPPDYPHNYPLDYPHNAMIYENVDDEFAGCRGGQGLVRHGHHLRWVNVIIFIG